MRLTPASGDRPLRRSELDAVGTRVPELHDARGDLLRCPGDTEALEWRGVARSQPERRIEVRNDTEVRLDGNPRTFARPVAVVVDHADGADDDLHRRIRKPLARDGDEVGVRTPSQLQLVCDRPGPAHCPPSPRADEERDRIAHARVGKRRPGREREPLARDTGLVAG